MKSIIISFLVFYNLIDVVMCHKCDDCSSQWRHRIGNLKSTSEDVIKRASAVNQKVINQLGVTQMQNPEELKLTYDSSDNFASLEAKLDAVGPIALTTKRHGDQIKMLLEDIHTIQGNIKSLRHELINLENLKSVNIPRLNRARANLVTNSRIIKDLRHLVDSIYRESLLEVQMLIPQSAIKLVQDNKARSFGIVNRTILYKNDIITSLDVKLKSSAQQVDILEQERNSSDTVTLEMIDGVLQNKGMDLSINDSALNLIDNETHILKLRDRVELARFLSREVNVNAHNYGPSTGKLLDELERSNNTINTANEIINIIEESFDKANKNLTDIQSIIDIRYINFSDMNQIVDEASRDIKMKINQIDMKRESAQSELAGIRAASKSSNEIYDKLHNISLDISRMLKTNAPTLRDFHEKNRDDIGELKNLLNKSSSLESNLNKMEDTLSKVSKLRTETVDYNHQKDLVDRSINEESLSINSLLSECILEGEKTLARSDGQDQFGLKRQTLDLQDRFSASHMSVSNKQLQIKQAIDRQSATLTELNHLNRFHLDDILGKKLDLISLLIILNDKSDKWKLDPGARRLYDYGVDPQENLGRGVRMSDQLDAVSSSESGSTELKSYAGIDSKKQIAWLDRKKRLLNVESSYQSLNRELNELVFKTSNLDQELKANENQLNLQRSLIGYLNEEIDTLGEDIEVKLNTIDDSSNDDTTHYDERTIN